MGNGLSLPLPCWERIIHYLPIPDIIQLCHADEECFILIRRNRLLWQSRAQQFFDLDPSLFARFAMTESDPLHDLVPAVCRADAMVTSVKANIESDNQIIRTHPVGGEVVLMSVDQKKRRVAVQLRTNIIRIYNLERMDGHVCGFESHRLQEMVLHGSVLFKREAANPSVFHTDVYSWTVEVEMKGLHPGYQRNCPAPLKRCDEHLMAYDRINHAALAYPLYLDGYHVHPHVVPFPPNTFLHDYAIRKNVIYAILSDGTAFVFVDFVLPSGEPNRKLVIATPTELHEPRISFPYVLITQRPFNHDGNRRNIGVYGARIWIPGTYARVEGGTTVVADYMVDPVSSSEYFLFLRDLRHSRTYVVRLGDMDTSFGVVDTINSEEEPIIASYGLSFVYCYSNRLVIRSYADEAFT